MLGCVFEICSEIMLGEVLNELKRVSQVQTDNQKISHYCAMLHGLSSSFKSFNDFCNLSDVL
mgnify:CR=1 FL=1